MESDNREVEDKGRAETATRAWDVETDPANPTPNIWPECPTCETAYVYRRGLSISRGWVWLWAADCKHKSPAVLMTDSGPYEPGNGSSPNDHPRT